MDRFKLSKLAIASTPLIPRFRRPSPQPAGYCTTFHPTSHAVWLPGFRECITNVRVPFGWRRIVACHASRSNVNFSRPPGRLLKTTSPCCIGAMVAWSTPEVGLARVAGGEMRAGNGSGAFFAAVETGSGDGVGAFFAAVAMGSGDGVGASFAALTTGAGGGVGAFFAAVATGSGDRVGASFAVLTTGAGGGAAALGATTVLAAPIWPGLAGGVFTLGFDRTAEPKKCHPPTAATTAKAIPPTSSGIQRLPARAFFSA